MSLYLDLKYINLISGRLLLFKKKNNTTFNFRCPLCGDSQMKQNKARGYFYKIPNKNEMSMKCHNCSASMYFGNFLQQFDSIRFKEYAFEKFKENNEVKKPVDIKKINFKVDSTKFSNETSLLDDLMPRLDTLEDGNEAVAFCIKRQIPRDKFNRLYFIDDVSKVSSLAHNKPILGHEPRLVLPFFNEKKELQGLACRALRGEKLRYINIKAKENANMIFGMDHVVKTKKIYAVEGPIDSLFLPNAIAMGGVAFGKMSSMGISKDKVIVILDNQPRNKEVCKQYERYIDDGYSICIWPQTLEEKDINDIVLSGVSPAKVKSLIDKNTYQGLSAKVQFISWKRV